MDPQKIYNARNQSLPPTPIVCRLIGVLRLAPRSLSRSRLVQPAQQLGAGNESECICLELAISARPPDGVIRATRAARRKPDWVSEHFVHRNALVEQRPILDDQIFFHLKSPSAS